MSPASGAGDHDPDPRPRDGAESLPRTRPRRARPEGGLDARRRAHRRLDVGLRPWCGRWGVRRGDALPPGRALPPDQLTDRHYLSRLAELSATAWAAEVEVRGTDIPDYLEGDDLDVPDPAQEPDGRKATSEALTRIADTLGESWDERLIARWNYDTTGQPTPKEQQG